MKPEEVKVKKSILFQIQLNDKGAEKQMLIAGVAQKETEIQLLLAKRTQAEAEEYRQGVEAGKRAVANERSGIRNLRLPGGPQN